MKNAVLQHDEQKDGGLFVFWAPHVIHTPLEVPEVYLARFAEIRDWRRRRYMAMVNYLDDSVGAVVDALTSRGLMESTLICFSSDNGGPVYGNGTSGANNWPLRGGKASNWEGGIRVNGWVSGGALASVHRGTRSQGLHAVWDWYATFAAVANVDSTDHRAALAGLPPVDGVSMWDYWSGNTASSPRKSLAIGSCTAHVHPPSAAWPADGFDEWCGSPTDTTTVAGLIIDNTDSNSTGSRGLWKLVAEPRIPMNSWQGPFFPNSTATAFETTYEFGCKDGCLFKLDVDPTEHHDLAKHEPALLESMKRQIAAHQKTAFSPSRGTPQLEAACSAAMNDWKGFWGPWLK